MIAQQKKLLILNFTTFLFNTHGASQLNFQNKKSLKRRKLQEN